MCDIPETININHTVIFSLHSSARYEVNVSNSFPAFYFSTKFEWRENDKVCMEAFTNLSINQMCINCLTPSLRDCLWKVKNPYRHRQSMQFLFILWSETRLTWIGIKDLWFLLKPIILGRKVVKAGRILSS